MHTYIYKMYIIYMHIPIQVYKIYMHIESDKKSKSSKDFIITFVHLAADDLLKVISRIIECEN